MLVPAFRSQAGLAVVLAAAAAYRIAPSIQLITLGRHHYTNRLSCPIAFISSSSSSSLFSKHSRDDDDGGGSRRDPARARSIPARFRKDDGHDRHLHRDRDFRPSPDRRRRHSPSFRTLRNQGARDYTDPGQTGWPRPDRRPPRSYGHGRRFCRRPTQLWPLWPTGRRRRGAWPRPAVRLRRPLGGRRVRSGCLGASRCRLGLVGRRLGRGRVVHGPVDHVRCLLRENIEVLGARKFGSPDAGGRLLGRRCRRFVQGRLLRRLLGRRRRRRLVLVGDGDLGLVGCRRLLRLLGGCRFGSRRGFIGGAGVLGRLGGVARRLFVGILAVAALDVSDPTAVSVLVLSVAAAEDRTLGDRGHGSRDNQQQDGRFHCGAARTLCRMAAKRAEH